MADAKGYVPQLPPFLKGGQEGGNVKRGAGNLFPDIRWDSGDASGSDLEARLTRLEKYLSEQSQWSSDEFTSISKNIMQQDFFILNELHVAPTKPREGMVIHADGTDWNPGSGKGIYAYLSGSWEILS